MTVYEIEPREFNNKLAVELKKIEEYEIPEWAFFVKSGVAKERPSQDPDFWYKRAASVLRQIYIHGTVGVNRLRVRYGSKKARGVRPSRFRPASGKMLRLILQQSEKAGLLQKEKTGRKLTEKGKKLVESIK
ncbi:MAG: 30S ribosomal protein S19e [Candidatus Pacearchaeota archaeon]|jgi:small subunit ribosomal protein S19e